MSDEKDINKKNEELSLDDFGIDLNDDDVDESFDTVEIVYEDDDLPLVEITEPETEHIEEDDDFQWSDLLQYDENKKSIINGISKSAPFINRFRINLTLGEKQYAELKSRRKS